jgi:hypothetical protein
VIELIALGMNCDPETLLAVLTAMLFLSILTCMSVIRFKSSLVPLLLRLDKREIGLGQLKRLVSLQSFGSIWFLILFILPLVPYRIVCVILERCTRPCAEMETARVATSVFVAEFTFGMVVLMIFLVTMLEILMPLLHVSTKKENYLYICGLVILEIIPTVMASMLTVVMFFVLYSAWWNILVSVDGFPLRWRLQAFLLGVAATVACFVFVLLAMPFEFPHYHPVVLLFGICLDVSLDSILGSWIESSILLTESSGK